MIIAGTESLGIVIGCTFEALELQMLDANGDPVDITGASAKAQVRSDCGDTLIVDLNPSVTNGPLGIVTIPEIDKADTATLPMGTYRWDFLLQDVSGKRAQLIKGPFPITCSITEFP